MELKEIIEATKNFRSDMFKGEGAFCKVYKAWIDEHTLTATEPGLGMAVTVKIWHQSKLERLQNWLVGLCLNFRSNLSRPKFLACVSLIFHFCRRKLNICFNFIIRIWLILSGIVLRKTT